MSQFKKGDSAHGTGDLNLAGACMAVGVPLDQAEPVQAIKRDNGNDYSRFFLCGWSIDGKLTLDQLLKAWDNPKWAASVEPLKGFSWVMDFITARPRGSMNSADWFDHAFDFLRSHGQTGSYAWPRRLEDIGDFVKANAETMAGYVFAFLVNRDLCLHLAKRAASRPYLMLSKGKDHAMIAEKSPKWRRDQFIKMIG